MTPAERATSVVDLYCFMRGSGTATDERLRQDIEQAIILGTIEAVAEWMTGRGYAAGSGDMLDDLLARLVAHAPHPRC